MSDPTREKFLIADRLDVRGHLNMLPGSVIDLAGSILGPNPVAPLFVDTVNGLDTNDGGSWQAAFKTMSAALTAVSTGGIIFFRGDVREELVGSNLKFDVTIIGVGSLHHPDLPAAGYHPGACMWRPPASPTTATPLLKVRARGWKFINIAFDCPVDSAAVQIERNASSGVDEHDGSHASFIGCVFRQGAYGIYDVSGVHNITVQDCEFFMLTTCAIQFGNTSVIALPLKWTIKANRFFGKGSTAGNGAHIQSALTASIIQDNVLGTLESTGKYIDLTGGSGNVVCTNVFGGVYDTGDYVGGTNDVWLGNRVAVKATTAPDGVTLAAPAAP